MRKILLIVSPNVTGLQYYRQLMPHNHLVGYYEGFEVKQVKCAVDSFDKIPDSLLKEYHAVHFIRQISLQGKTEGIVKRCHSLGLKVFFDIDDYWRLPAWHPMYDLYQRGNYPKNIDQAIKYADIVTTTNVWLQRQISKINPNVFVLNNAIDTDLPQYKKVDIKNRRLRFGWIGGVYHLTDIELLRADMYKFYKDEQCVNEAQICLGGYTFGQHEYEKIEEVLTFNYSLDKDYKNYLLKKTPLISHMMNDKPYKRIYARDVDSYMKLYNEIDISIIPLRDNLFNACKSELKMIEAGTMGKACIVSEVSPYILGMNKKNSFKVNKHNTFYDGIKFFLNNRSAVQEYTEALSESVNTHYNMLKVNTLRAELYNYYLQ